MALNKSEQEFIRTYAECNMSNARAAEVMHMNPNSIAQRVNKLREKTGLDPRQAVDLFELMKQLTPVKAKKIVKSKEPETCENCTHCSKDGLFIWCLKGYHIKRDCKCERYKERGK